MKKFNLIAGVALLSVLGATAFTSCGNCDKTDKKVAEQGACSSDAMTFKSVDEDDYYTLKGSAADYQRPTDVVVEVSGELMFPCCKSCKNGSDLRAAIYKAAYGDGYDTLKPDDALEAYLKATVDSMGYATVKTDDTTDAQGFVNVKGGVVALTEDYLSYAVSKSVYYPMAANASTEVNYVVYDLDNGKVLTAADLFTPAGLAAIPEVLAQTLADKNVSTFDPVTALPAGDNFYINYEGQVVFVYQQGEITARAAGAVSAAFYPAQLDASYLTPLAKKLLLGMDN